MISITVIIPTVRNVDLNLKCLKRQSVKDFEVIIQKASKPKNGNVWSFNHDMNEALKKAKGELIISYQDNIWISPYGIQKFVIAYNVTGACITGVGHIYKDLVNWKPENQVWTDPRMRRDLGTFYECMPVDWELNWCAAPKKAFKDIGGFDETMDKLYGMDNVDVATRMDKLGYKFYIDQTNECRGLYHERRKDWDEKHWMFNGYYRRKPKKVDYL